MSKKLEYIESFKTQAEFDEYQKTFLQRIADFNSINRGYVNSTQFDPKEWGRFALCAVVVPAKYYDIAQDNKAQQPMQHLLAKKACSNCLVKTECLEDAKKRIRNKEKIVSITAGKKPVELKFLATQS